MAAISTVHSLEASPYHGLSQEKITRKLFCACEARQIVVVILQALRAKYAFSERVDVQFVRYVTREYGGKVPWYTGAEPEVSAAMYFKLVYDSFLFFRFQRLREPGLFAISPGETAAR